MELTSWFGFAVAVLIATISPGPNVLVVVLNTHRYGLLAAPYTIAGNLSCLLIFALLAATGIGTLLHLYPHLLITLKLVGALYLIYLGAKLVWQSRRLPSADALEATSTTANNRLSSAAQPSASFKPWQLFRDGFVVSASNPKSILFLSSVFPAFISPNQALAPQFAVMFTTIICSVAGIHGAYALLAHYTAGRWRQAQSRARFSLFTGMGFILFGLILLPIRRLMGQN